MTEPRIVHGVQHDPRSIRWIGKLCRRERRLILVEPAGDKQFAIEKQGRGVVLAFTAELMPVAPRAGTTIVNLRGRKQSVGVEARAASQKDVAVGKQSRRRGVED